MIARQRHMYLRCLTASAAALTAISPSAVQVFGIQVTRLKYPSFNAVRSQFCSSADSSSGLLAHSVVRSTRCSSKIHSTNGPIHGLFVRRMTSAYSGDVGDGRLGLEPLLERYLPFRTTLPKTGMEVEVGPFRDETEWQQGMDLMNLIIREGKSWPFDQEYETMDAYRSYFLSHAAFVVRRVPLINGEGDDLDEHLNDVMGCFYVKPNFPGRCSHICNGGFITSPKYRRQGVARLMGRCFLQFAHDLGYKSAYFNLVFASNTASVALWESLGFQRVAVLEAAADLDGADGLDTAYGYRFDLTKLSENYLFDDDD